MQIVCTTTFMDGVNRFEQGAAYSVSDALGRSLVAMGWAREDGAPHDAGATLEIQNSAIGLKDPNHG